MGKKRVTINISNRTIYSFAAIFLIVAIAGIAYAQTEVSHSVSQVSGLSSSTVIDGGDVGYNLGVGYTHGAACTGSWLESFCVNGNHRYTVTFNKAFSSPPKVIVGPKYASTHGRMCWRICG